jgi:RNA polymerase sigma-70 factor (ECF subfamily)
LDTDRSNADEAWLVLRAQAGSRAHLERLITIAYQFLGARLAPMFGQKADADDALQDALFTICRRLGSLNDARLFRPWAHRTAIRIAWKAINRRRVDHSRRSDVELDHVPASIPESTADVASIIARVSPASRVVLTLHYLEGKTIEATAEELGVAPGTVKSRLAYGLRQLREAMPNVEG